MASSGKSLLIDQEPISGSLFDFGLFFFHNAHNLLKKGSGPYFYLPKMENHFEAKLWNDVFIFAQKELGIPRGTIRATVLLETILAAFEMEEILYELKEHSAGLNAGRWDYIFSVIKKFRQRDEVLLPDRAQITMKVPFMRAYAQLLVETCHKRGAHALGGMAGQFIPSRKDKKVNEIALAKVKEDKDREISDGFDGTWVAHPDLVPIAHNIFAEKMGTKSNQKEVKPTHHISDKQLYDFKVPGGTITEDGVRTNISVSLQYLAAWLSGTGAVAINNLMEDAATAEISRAQLWQWVHHPNGKLKDGRKIDQNLYLKFADEEVAKINSMYQQKGIALPKLKDARKLLDELVLNKEFPEFLTLLAYQQL